MKVKSDLIYKIIGIGLFIYLLVLLGRTSFLNYKINKQIEDLRTSIEDLDKENKDLANDLEYYKTDQYKEKVARQRLGLKKSDEEVMVLVPENKGDKESSKKDKSNYLKWLDFLSGKG